MPKGAKPAPAQQSNLLEMWKAGKRKAGVEPKREVKDEDVNIEMKEEEFSKMDMELGMLYAGDFHECVLTWVCEQGKARSRKRCS